ncbi:hypothetical protein AMTR_s00095p00137270 [Amborella trichopoda]|uniref:Uncharacterized protein n=1 Tax=Amborella trichopoda TaxID=13333 RepID=W1NU81_AMBTC|nr:hypothetical protein AMTR_s00095p00137270 [Amborella trichopoda]
MNARCYSYWEMSTSQSKCNRSEGLGAPTMSEHQARSCLAMCAFGLESRPKHNLVRAVAYARLGALRVRPFSKQQRADAGVNNINGVDSVASDHFVTLSKKTLKRPKTGSERPKCSLGSQRSGAISNGVSASASASANATSVRHFLGKTIKMLRQEGATRSGVDMLSSDIFVFQPTKEAKRGSK